MFHPRHSLVEGDLSHCIDAVSVFYYPHRRGRQTICKQIYLLIEGNLTCTTSSGQSGPRSNVNEMVLHRSQVLESYHLIQFSVIPETIFLFFFFFAGCVSYPVVEDTRCTFTQWSLISYANMPDEIRYIHINKKKGSACTSMLIINSKQNWWW